MEGDPHHETLWVVAFHEQQLELVNKDGHKLNHLESGQVLLPPDVLLIFRAHGGNHVIEVHDDVDERVQESKECAVTTWGEFQSHPNAHWHNSMVNNVQRRHLVVFLPQDKEECVKEFRELGNVIPPTCPCHPHGQRTSGVVDWLTPQTVVHTPSARHVLIKYPETEQGLKQVIYNENFAQLEGLPVFHELGSQDPGEVAVEQADA